MSIDNRTEINDCESSGTTFVTIGAQLGTSTLTGTFIEGAASVDVQHSNVFDQTHTTTDSAGVALNLDLSDATIYIPIKDGLQDSFINGGAQVFIGDGTNEIGYYVGGNDAVGLAITPFFNVFKLDVSVSVGAPESNNAYSGTEAALTQTTISQVGYGSLHLAKGQGSITNVFIDRFTYIANGSYALTINGGTVGTPETMLDVQGDDVTNGWGMVANPLGAQFGFFIPTEWGNSAATADVYFTASNEQWYWLGDNAGGHAVGSGNFPFRIVGNATDTIDIKWTSLVIVNTGARAEFIAGDTNVDIMQFENVAFTDVGTITFPVLDTGNKFVNDSTFNNCGQVDPSTTAMDGCTFNGALDPNGALLVAATTANLSNLTFNSDGTGHGIYITVAGTYDFDNFKFSGYSAGSPTGDEAIYNNSGGLVTINVINGGDTPSVRNADGSPASTTIVNNSVTVLVQGVSEAAAVKVVANETVGTITTGDVILEALADSNGEASIAINYEAAFDPSGLDVIVRARASGLPAAAIQDDNGVFLDETTAANSAITADMNLLPAVPVVNEDRYLFGHPEMFNQMKLVINTAGTGGFTITWQYWNGAWTNLADVVDDTSSFSVAGKNVISYTLPGDWVTTTVNGQGPYYYIRAAYTAGTVTVVPTGTKCTLDVTKYLPFVQNRIITSSGLTVNASWQEDTIATF